MKPLAIELVKGQKREFTFLGWKDDGLSFFATRMDGRPAVITPVSAYPDDRHSGEPYRFPRIVPLEITPKQFEIAWSDHHRKVLSRWREAKQAEVDAETQETLFPFDGMGEALGRPRTIRTPAELNRRRQEIKDVIESRYRELMETPLVELLDQIAFPYLLEDFHHGRWADEMGEDFRVMMNQAGRFNTRWHDAYNGQGDHQDYQGMLSALRSVRLVIRGHDKQDYPLTGVEVRRPTDLEAQAYALLRELVRDKSAPPQGQSKSAEPKAKATKVKAIDKPKGGARFENDFSLAVIPRQKGEPLLLTIEPEFQSLLKRIIAAGGNIPRTKLRQGKTDTFQPEKYLRSQTAQALVKAGLVGKQRKGRTTVFWAKSQAD